MYKNEVNIQEQPVEKNIFICYTLHKKGWESEIGAIF